MFFLLSTQGQLHRGFWLDALAYWPVLLIALGLRLIFERSRTPWAVLLSPVIIMETLSFVAWRGPDMVSADWRTVRAARDPQVETWSLDARMDLTDLNLRAGPVAPGMLLQGRTTPSNRGSVRVSDRGDTARGYLRSDVWGSGNVHFLPSSRRIWDVDIADDLPIALHLVTSFADGQLDLETIEVTRADLDGAFNDLLLRLGPPRKDTRVPLEGAFNHLELLVPEDTPVSSLPTVLLTLWTVASPPTSSADQRTGCASRVRSIKSSFARNDTHRRGVPPHGVWPANVLALFTDEV